MTRWQKIADDLRRLAKDQAGKPEGELALQKLHAILAKHPEAQEPVRPTPPPMPPPAVRPVVIVFTYGWTSMNGADWLFSQTGTTGSW